MGPSSFASSIRLIPSVFLFQAEETEVQRGLTAGPTSQFKRMKLLLIKPGLSEPSIHNLSNSGLREMDLGFQRESWAGLFNHILIL
jgi:hypothetical protein